MKSILIIGSGPGISRGVARRFGKEGFAIGLIARKADKLAAETELLRSEGLRVEYAVADAGDAASLSSGIDQLRSALGEPEVYLYNVSAAPVMDMLEQNWETIRNGLDINAGGAFHLLKKILPERLAANTGKIFITGGGFSLSGDPQWIVLSVGKAALRNIVQAGIKRAAGSGVHIAHLIVDGAVKADDEKYSPAKIADHYWRLYLQQPGAFENEFIY